MKKIIKTIVSVFAFIICLVVVLSLFTPDNSSDTTTNNTTVQSTETTSEKDNYKKIYEDEYIKASYIDCYEEEAVEGCAYLALKIENKPNKTFMVSLSDASINDTMVNTGSGVPMIIKPDKNSRQPFILFTGAAGIDSVDEIKTISFKIVLLDNDTVDTIEKTKEIEVNVK